MNKPGNIIAYLFYTLFFFVPLVLFPQTSELFEFNKIILVYAFTTLILAFWLVRMIAVRKFIFRRTILDIPLLVFLGANILSTLTSIDTRTSIFGYYSRFNGGLLSLISYSLLYWAYVANVSQKQALKSIRVTLVSAFLVSIYAILEHFGIDKDIWVQDVQSRVFSTLGQPNWLAAWICALIPITWAFAQARAKKNNYLIWVGLSSIFFITLLYTGSRSGLLGFVSASAFFWIFSFVHKRKEKAYLKDGLLKTFVICNVIFLLIVALVGTQYTPSITDLLRNNKVAQEDNSQKNENETDQENVPQNTALETGGSRSSEIRRVVWKGAINLWKKYPILGTGVETFAFAYYEARPVEHNMLSEWNFLYNKAHNEYLNFAATTGTVGILSYATLIIFMGIVFLKVPQVKSSIDPTRDRLLNTAFASGWISILVTNFFGFSVVPVSLQFFIFPAFAFAIFGNDEKEPDNAKASFSSSQKIAIGFVVTFALYIIILITRYWYADFLYAKGKLENDSGNYTEARQLLQKAISLSSKESVFWEELSTVDTQVAISLFENEKADLASQIANEAISASTESIRLSPANVNLKRTRASMFIKLSVIDINYLLNARDTLFSATSQAPTDAQLFYNLGLAYTRTGEIEKALSVFYKTIEMKKDYRNARLAAAILLSENNDKEAARKQLEYILENINPNDQLAKQELEELGK